jgi:PAS domain S-box-containing protein
MPLTAFLVGSLNRRAARALAEAEVAALRQARLEDRARAAEALRDAERQLRTLVENFPDFIARFDRDCRRLYVNPSVTRAFGLPLECFVGKSLQELAMPGPPGQDEALQARIRQAAEEGVPNVIETHWGTTRGERIFEVRHVPERDERGNVVSVLAISRDITERKRAEDALQVSHNLLSAVFEATPDVLFVKDLEGRALAINSAGARLLGRSQDEILGRDDTALLPPEAARAIMRDDRRVMASGLSETFEEHVTIAGTTRTYLTTKDVYRDAQRKVAGLIGIARDVTERRRDEQALRESEELYRLLTENSNDLIYMVDLEGRIIYASPSVGRLLGRVPRHGLEVVHPEDVEAGKATWERILAGQRGLLNVRVRDADGACHWLESSSALIDYQGQPHVLSVCRDITERKRFEEVLRRNEAYLAEAQRLGRTGSWAWDVATREFVHWSREHYRLHGLDPQQRTPSWEAVQQFIHPDDRARCLEQIDRAVQGRTDCQLEYRTVLPDGTMKYIHSISHPVFNAAGELVEFVGTEMDITERKHAEEQLRASLREKEALLKEVHHRVKNNLQLISSLLSLQAARVEDHSARRALADSRDRVRSLALVHENLYRAGNFAGVPLAAQVQSLCAHLLRSYGGDSPRVDFQTRIADVALDLERAVPFVLIINELVSNALKHAFPGGRGGRVSVELRALAGGRYALTVADDGVGLPTEIDLAGSGSLGLQLVSDLAQQLYGTVAVRRDGGTLFTITFDADPGGG